MTTACLACAAPVFAATVDGHSVWLDAATVEQANTGVIAYNPRTGNGRRLTVLDAPNVQAWIQGGVTLHREHEQVCDPQPVLQGFPGR